MELFRRDSTRRQFRLQEGNLKAFLAHFFTYNYSLQLVMPSIPQYACEDERKVDLKNKLANLFGDDSDDDGKVEVLPSPITADTEHARMIASKRVQQESLSQKSTNRTSTSGEKKLKKKRTASRGKSSMRPSENDDDDSMLNRVRDVSKELFEQRRSQFMCSAPGDNFRSANPEALLEDPWVGVSEIPSPLASEAEEEDSDIEELFGRGHAKGGRRIKQSESVISSEVLNFLARMEVATEQDRELVSRQLPATHKLKMLGEVTDKLTQVDLHESFLRHGLLKVLAQWLTLLPNKNLPNITVRTTVIDCIRQLPIETGLADRKEELKHSGLGCIIMFLSNLPEETPANRKKCKYLVEKWSRPVYELSSQYCDIRHQVEGDSGERCTSNKKRRREKAAKTESATEDNDLSGRTNNGPQYGDPGYRYHAVVPEAETFDYAIQPRLRISPLDIRARTQHADEQRVRKLVSKVSKKKGLKDGKAFLPSIEGRGMITYR